MPVGDPIPSPRRLLRPALRVACAVAAALSFAASSVTADVCVSNTAAISAAGPFFTTCTTSQYQGIGGGLPMVYVWGAVSSKVNVSSTGGTSGGAGQLIQILQATATSKASPSVVYSTNWENTCDLACGSQGNKLSATTAGTQVAVACSLSGSPLYYAVKGFSGTTLAADNQNHSPCDGPGGSGPWVAVAYTTAWLAASSANTGCCP